MSKQESRLLIYPISEGNSSERNFSPKAGRRVQDILMKEQGYSLRLIRRLKQQPGAVRLDGVPVRMIDRVSPPGTLEVRLPADEGESALKKAADGDAPPPVPILYEDADVLVYHKPPFLAMHPCRDHQRDTLAEVFIRDMRARGVSAPVFRPVYRLDRDTDGLCVIAKNTLATARLARAVEKEYTAVACGRVEPSAGTIDAPIAQLVLHQMKRGVRLDGQRAVTHYEVLAYSAGNPDYTLLRLRLETGRTHQIRVHFAYLGHPLAGDVLYGAPPLPVGRQALTCTRVRFVSPGSKKLCEICINIQEELINLMQNE